MRHESAKFLARSLTALSPGLGLAAADWSARLIHRFSRTRQYKHVPSPVEFESLYGEKIAREIGNGHLGRAYSVRRYRLLALREIAARRGLTATLPYIRIHGEERLVELASQGKPVIFTTWHTGPYMLISSVLVKHKIPVLKIQDKFRFEPPSNWEIVLKSSDEASGRMFMKKALKKLSGGGIVMLACDGFSRANNCLSADLFSNKAPFKRGPAALAQMSGAPIVPMCAWWDDRELVAHVEIQEPLPMPGPEVKDSWEYERGVVKALGARFEKYMRDHPYEMSAVRMRFLLTWEPDL